MDLALFLKENFREQGTPYEILNKWEYWEIMLLMITMNKKNEREAIEQEKAKRKADGKTQQYFKRDKTKEQSEVSKKWRENLKKQGLL